MIDVRLRTLRDSEVEILVQVRIAEAGTMGQPGPAPDPDEIRPGIRQRVAHSGEFHAGEILLAIEADGRLVIPASGVTIGDELVQALRVADRR